MCEFTFSSSRSDSTPLLVPLSGCSQGEPLSTGKCGPEKVRNRTEDSVPPYLKLSVERGVITLSSTEGPSVWIAPQPSTNPAPVAVRNEGPAEDHPASYARSQVQPSAGACLTLVYPAALGESSSASEIETEVGFHHIPSQKW